MNIDVIYQYVLFIMNKYQSGYLSGQKFTTLFNQEQTAYYDMLLGHVEQYQYGRPVPRVGMGMTENVTTKLIPFLIPISNASVSAQQVTKPESISRLVAMRTSANGQIDRVEHDRKAYRIGSAVLSSRPFYCEYATYWEIWPSSIGAVNYEYYPGKPADAEWGFDLVSNREVYNADTSTDPLWADTDISAIVARMLKKIGCRLDDQQLSQLGQSIIQAGE